MSSFFKFCKRGAWEPNGRRSDTEKILELNNGTSFIWGHLDDPDTLTLRLAAATIVADVDAIADMWREPMAQMSHEDWLTAQAAIDGRRVELSK